MVLFGTKSSLFQNVRFYIAKNNILVEEMGNQNLKGSLYLVCYSFNYDGQKNTEKII